MSSKVFVGDSREKLVTGLVNKYEDVRKSGRSHWVSLEAPRGWGKTCVGREFYKRLAVGQDMPYWPDEIDKDNIDRKEVDPRGFNKKPHSLPSYLWWGFSCSAVRNQGSTSRELSKEVDRLQDHKDSCLRAIRKQDGRRWRHKKILPQNARGEIMAILRNLLRLSLSEAVRLFIEYFLTIVVSIVVTDMIWESGGVISHVIVGLPLTLFFFVIRVIPREVKELCKKRVEFDSITPVGYEPPQPEDVVDKALDFFRKINAPSVPLVNVG